MTRASVAEYPDDADGEALRRVAADGSDLTRPMDVDFMIDVRGGIAADAIAAEARQRGFDVEVVDEDDDEDAQGVAEDLARWTVYCTRHMLLTYDAVVRVQAELDTLAKPHGGRSDGWGTFGNADK